jgi:hypothetical protein
MTLAASEILKKGRPLAATGAVHTQGWAYGTHTHTHTHTSVHKLVSIKQQKHATSPCNKQLSSETTQQLDKDQVFA